MILFFYNKYDVFYNIFNYLFYNLVILLFFCKGSKIFVMVVNKYRGFELFVVMKNWLG